MNNARHQQRARLRDRRRRVPPRERRRAALLLVRNFFRLPGYLRARHVALYCPVGAEMDVWPLVLASLDAGKRVYLPVVRGPRMSFIEYRRGDPLRPAAFGIPEPDRGRPPVRRRSLDWVVVPLVGFDERGNRIGQGGGYYDRAFAAHRGVAWRKPVLAGAAFEVQRCERVDTECWDVTLDVVVTEARAFRASASAAGAP